jgi:hypothetical protein
VGEFIPNLVVLALEALASLLEFVVGPKAKDSE